MELLSVIVAIYNVQDWLERCVRSILEQTWSNLEILLVDDGSTDGCPALCDRFAREDSRVRVIHKENGGLSDARNAGIESIFFSLKGKSSDMADHNAHSYSELSSLIRAIC